MPKITLTKRKDVLQIMPKSNHSEDAQESRQYGKIQQRIEMKKIYKGNTMKHIPSTRFYQFEPSPVTGWIPCQNYKFNSWSQTWRNLQSLPTNCICSNKIMNHQLWEHRHYAIWISNSNTGEDNRKQKMHQNFKLMTFRLDKISTNQRIF